MVWDLGPLFPSGLGGPNVHVLVDLAAIGVDYLAAKLLSESYCELGLARGCGADYVEYAGIV